MNISILLNNIYKLIGNDKFYNTQLFKSILQL